MRLALQMVAVLALLLAGAGLLRRVPPRLAALLWVAVPLALLPRWLDTAARHHWSAFLWAKVFSVAFACAFFAACAGGAFPPRAVSVGGAVFLALNMLEAVALDAAGGNLANALAGIVVLVAAPWERIARVEGAGRDRRLVSDLSWSWIAAYSGWNACFVYGNWGAYPFGQHVAVIGAALALALRDGRRTWLVARAETLGLYLLAYATFFGWFRTSFDTSAWSTPWARAALTAGSVVLALGALAGRLAGRRTSGGASCDALVKEGDLSDSAIPSRDLQ